MTAFDEQPFQKRSMQLHHDDAVRHLSVEAKRTGDDEPLGWGGRWVPDRRIIIPVISTGKMMGPPKHAGMRKPYYDDL